MHNKFNDSLSKVEQICNVIKAFINFNLNLKNDENSKESLAILANLHSIQNDPTTRNLQNSEIKFNQYVGPVAKAKYIESKAKEILTERGLSEDLVEFVEAIDPITESRTYNVIVTLGSVQTGPVVDIMAHHDTIDAKNYSLSVLNDGDKQVLYGRTLQDDTIHVSALLASLKYIEVPKQGAIRLIFTDFEENGCRGSSALIEKLLEGIPTGNQYAVVALESAEGNLAYGHRGKFSAYADASNIGNLKNAYMNWYEKLVRVQLEIDKNSGISTLGKTCGTTTFGKMTKRIFNARLDFRTNSVMVPEKVHDVWNSILSSKQSTELDILTHAKRSIDNHEYKLLIEGNVISIESVNAPSHPSVIEVENDSTVIPILFLLLQILDFDINQITWGNPQKQNSNPIVGSIRFTNPIPANLTPEKLFKSMNGLENIDTVDNLALNIELNHMDKSDCVETDLSDGIFNEILENFNSILSQEFSHTAEAVTVSYMSDAARIFNQANRKGLKAYGMVFGVGNPKYLHKTERNTRLNERLSAEDVLLASKGLVYLPQIIHRVLLTS